jgi:hypothetical protein
MTANLARILLTGSRSWTDTQLLEDTLLQIWHDALALGYDGILLTHGACPDGADHQGNIWATRNSVPTDPHPADWEGPCGTECRPGHRRPRRGTTYCPLAGHRRNQTMVDLKPVLVVAAHRDGSRGTADCLRRAKKAGIPTLVLAA